MKHKNIKTSKLNSQEITKDKLLPPMTQTKIGIDAGGTLIKIAYTENNQINFKKVSSLNMKEAVQWIQSTFEHPIICVTGGKSKLLENLLPFPVQEIVEFEATCGGASYLMNKYELPIVEEGYILTNVGTGTSIHYIADQTYTRIGGTGVGGGTLMGLSYLLTGEKEYAQIIKEARNGKRDLIDLKVKDIYTDSEPPISGDLTASNFGNINHHFETSKPISKDSIASIIGMIGETISTISCLAAQRFNTSSIIYIGSTFQDNPLLKQVIIEYTQLRDGNPFFMKNGEFSGAIGALQSLK